jgi:hypothetical protein
MLRSLPIVRTGLSVAAALVLLTACGGSDKGNSASSSTKAGSSASATSAQAAGSEFCTKAAGLAANLGSAVVNQSDPAAAQQGLRAAVTQIRAIDPPSEIASDWSALADGVEQLANASAGVDFNDPSAVATFQQTATQLETKLSGASTNVEKYLSEKCGLTSSTESAAPTS